jgi:hypothetical protein
MRCPKCKFVFESFPDRNGFDNLHCPECKHHAKLGEFFPVRWTKEAERELEVYLDKAHSDMSEQLIKMAEGDEEALITKEYVELVIRRRDRAEEGEKDALPVLQGGL